MVRYAEIDILKGIAVIFMVIFHIYYYPYHYGYKEIRYDKAPLPLIARISQLIFITSVGINLVIVYSKKVSTNQTDKEYYEKQLKRIVKLVIGAGFMSLFTYFIFGDNFVKFGILHFIALGSLLMLPILDKPQVIYGISIVILTIYGLKRSGMTFNIPGPLGFILGLNTQWRSIDHFPLIPWFLVMCLGVLIGHKLKESPLDVIPENVKENGSLQLLQKIGSHSFEIYIVHWLVLYLIYSHIYPRFRVS